MRIKIKIIEISDDLKSKSNHDFDFKIKIVPISGTRELLLHTMAKNYRRSVNKRTDGYKDRNGQLLVQPEDIAERWREYFTNQLNVQKDTAFEISSIFF